MKIKICLILIFIFSFCGSFIKVAASTHSAILDKIEDSIYDNGSFIENGVRITYNSHLKKEDEMELVKKELKRNFNKEVVINDDEIDIGTSLEKIKVNFFLKNNETMVDLSIVNYNEMLSVSKLMKELAKCQNKNIFNIRYFQYIKGKIDNVDDALIKINRLHQIKNIDTLEIHNGYVGTANFCNGERVNIAVNSYDTGNYLIIGTPVIFTTY